MSTLQVTLKQSMGIFDLDVKFEVRAAGVIALFGRSGCGKTSVLRAIAGLAQTDSTVIRFNGDIWQDKSTFLPPYTRPIAYVFQEASLFPHMSVRSNLQYGWKKTPESRRKITLDNAIELLGIGHLLDRASVRLSGGERQRVAIARALLTSPQLLLMDEPLSALDHDAKQSILPYLESLHDDFNIPAVYVSHDPYEVARLADQMVYLDNGRVNACGDTAELLTSLDLPMANYDEASSILEGYVSTHDPHYNLTWIGMDPGQIAVTRTDLSVGKRIRIQIHAKDVSITLTPHSDSSIINVLPATIIDTHDRDSAQTNIRLKLQNGQTLLSRITRHSAVSLGLHKGMSVFAQVKGNALI